MGYGSITSRSIAYGCTVCGFIAYKYMAYGSIAYGYIVCGFIVCKSKIAFSKNSISVPLDNRVVV